MYCKNCGNLIDDKAVICPKCGTETKPQSSGGSNFLFALLGFLVPLAGLILYIACKTDNPDRAKAAGKGAIVGVIVSVLLSILLIVVSIIGGSLLFDEVVNTLDDSTFYGDNFADFEELLSGTLSAIFHR